MILVTLLAAPFVAALLLALSSGRDGHAAARQAVQLVAPVGGHHVGAREVHPRALPVHGAVPHEHHHHRLPGQGPAHLEQAGYDVVLLGLVDRWRTKYHGDWDFAGHRRPPVSVI